jgi:phytoene dehydrogenase-like protein
MRNRGAHALYPSSERLLRALGAAPTGGHPKPGLVLREGRLIPSMFGPGAVLGGSPLRAGERREFVGALASVALGDPAGSAGSDAAAWVDAHARGAFLNDLLQGLFRLATYAGDLSELPGEIGRMMLRESIRRPVRYLDGGWQRIADALASRARERGAVLSSGARVTGLEMNRAGGVVRISGGREQRARAVVLAGLSPARAMRLLDGAGGALPASVAEPRAVRAACLDVALSRLPRQDTRFVLGIDQPLYLSVHSAWSELAPGAGAVVHLMRYEGSAPVAAADALAQLEALMDLAQPGWRGLVVHRRFAPRMVVAHHLPAPGEGLVSRPGPADTGLPGVLLAGDWIGPQGWLAGASLASGVAAARVLLDDGRRAPRGSPSAAGAGTRAADAAQAAEAASAPDTADAART